MPRITPELRRAEALFAAAGRDAVIQAKAKAAALEAEGSRPAARSWRETAAWCEAMADLAALQRVAAPQMQLRRPFDRLAAE